MPDHHITAVASTTATWELYYDAEQGAIDSHVDVRVEDYIPPYNCECGETFDTDDAAYEHLLAETDAEQ